MSQLLALIDSKGTNPWEIGQRRQRSGPFAAYCRSQIRSLKRTRMPEARGMVVGKIASWPLTLTVVAMTFAGRAFAADGYQTNLGPTPLDGSNRATVLGRGAVLATLDRNKFTLHGSICRVGHARDRRASLHGQCDGRNRSGHLRRHCHAGAERRDFRHRDIHARTGCGVESRQDLFVLDSQKAPKGNLWGWFQPAHKTVGPDVPEHGHWYIPNILQDNTPRKNPQS